MYYLFQYQLEHEGEVFNAKDSFLLTNPQEAFDRAAEIAESTGYPVRMINRAVHYDHLIKPEKK